MSPVVCVREEEVGQGESGAEEERVGGEGAESNSSNSSKEGEGSSKGVCVL